MGTHPGTSEIVEEGEMNLSSQLRGPYRQNSEISIYEKERRSPVMKLKCKESLEDDLNQLFEAISIRTSTKSLDSEHHFGTSPFRRNAMKKPMTMGTPRSLAFGNAEPVSLKQALRDLCISKASEMAATKRLSKATASSGVSEAGRIKNLYSSVVEASKAGPSFDSSKGSVLEISIVPKESKSNVSEMPQHLQIPRPKSLSKNMQCSQSDAAVADAQDDTGTSLVHNKVGLFSKKVTKKTSDVQLVHKEKQIHAPSYCSKTDVSIDEGTGSVREINLVQADSRSVYSDKMSHPIQVSKLIPSNQSAHSSPRFGAASTQNSFRSPKMQDNSLSAVKGSKFNHGAHSSPKLDVLMIHNDSVSASKSIGSGGNLNVHSPKFGTATKQDIATGQNECVSEPQKVGSPTLKMELASEEKHTLLSTTSCAISGNSVAEPVDNGSVSTKLAKKASQPKLGRKGKVQSTPSRSVTGNRPSKVPRNASRSVKPVVRNKTVVKKKLKRRSTSSVHAADRDGDSDCNLDPTGQMVCQRCRCALETVNKESTQNSQVSPCTSGPIVDSNIIKPGLSKPGFAPKSYNSVVKVQELKSKEKGEFSQSSGSLGEYCSTSTSISDDSNASNSTCGNKPHMSKDVRWEAIHNIRKRHGILDLRHFNLLKKLGSGDIGTVYLAELIGTNCLFAIKVMDNEFLARRRKMPRAQTEREILKMLDHPFLPTLYAQFTSDNLSCLVMEYCPGGDLHVLRQRQPIKCFSEPAARFYVAEVLLALEYLHMLGIVYRDLKPENILVREDGHIMLTDFDLSLRCDVNPTLVKSSSCSIDPARISGPCTTSSCIGPFCIEPSCQVSCFSPRFLPATTKTRKLKPDLAAHVRSLPQLVAEPTDARSNSFVGTHEYLAPEIIKGEGHGAAVDWWTFGVFLYELLYGRTPFRGAENEETLANVVLQSLKFPDTPFVSLQARDLIRGLLVKDPENRLGSVKGAAEIKQHPFFDGLNWALIRCAIPPELPEYYDYESPYTVPYDQNSSRLLECKATGEHLEFELF